MTRTHIQRGGTVAAILAAALAAGACAGGAGAASPPDISKAAYLAASNSEFGGHQRPTVVDTSFGHWRGFNDDLRWWATVTVDNPNPNAIIETEVVVLAFDAEDIMVASETHAFSAMPGESTIALTFLTGRDHQFERIEARTQGFLNGWDFGQYAVYSPGELGAFKFSGLELEIDERGWQVPRLTGTIHSTFDAAITSLDLFAIVRDKQGEVVYATQGFGPGEVPAHGGAHFDVRLSGYETIPPGSLIEVVAIPRWWRTDSFAGTPAPDRGQNMIAWPGSGGALAEAPSPAPAPERETAPEAAGDSDVYAEMRLLALIMQVSLMYHGFGVHDDISVSVSAEYGDLVFTIQYLEQVALGDSAFDQAITAALIDEVAREMGAEALPEVREVNPRGNVVIRLYNADGTRIGEATYGEGVGVGIPL